VRAAVCGLCGVTDSPQRPLRSAEETKSCVRVVAGIVAVANGVNRGEANRGKASPLEGVSYRWRIGMEAIGVDGAGAAVLRPYEKDGPGKTQGSKRDSLAQGIGAGRSEAGPLHEKDGGEAG
jgi:hypothetical protein